MKNMKPFLNVLWNLLLISLGSIVCAVAIKGILIPKEFLAGGVAGLAILVHYLVPSLPVGVIYFILNIPLFVVGWMFVGRRFFIYSLAGVAILSVALIFPYKIFPIRDMILAALTAGIISGVDILSIILYKKYSIRPGSIVLAFNALLLTAAALRIPLEMVLYTLIYMFVASYFVNLVVTGMSQRKAVMIISPQWEAISREIREKLQRGVTVVRGEGGYTGKEIQILYSVITFSELSRFKEMIKKTDPEAFVVVTETMEVMGKRIGNQPHW
jgi:uncharacterized membrane-anchored protein YitT (DUF2179 family)